MSTLTNFGEYIKTIPCRQHSHSVIESPDESAPPVTGTMKVEYMRGALTRGGQVDFGVNPGKGGRSLLAHPMHAPTPDPEGGGGGG
jgi:hypothetical protein